MTSTEKNEQLVLRIIEMYNNEYIKDETTTDDAFFFIHARRVDEEHSEATIRTSGNRNSLINGLFTYAVEDTDFAKVIGLTYLKLSPVMINMQRMASMAEGKDEDPCDCFFCRLKRGEL